MRVQSAIVELPRGSEYSDITYKILELLGHGEELMWCTFWHRCAWLWMVADRLNAILVGRLMEESLYFTIQSVIEREKSSLLLMYPTPLPLLNSFSPDIIGNNLSISLAPCMCDACLKMGRTERITLDPKILMLEE